MIVNTNIDKYHHSKPLNICRARVLIRNPDTFSLSHPVNSFPHKPHYSDYHNSR